MGRTVHCRKYQSEMEGLDSPPFPGPLGQDIFDNVSRQAWEEWQRHQTMLINERRLDMRDAEARRFLQEQMKLFFSGGEYAQAEGYVPPEKEQDGS